MTTQVAEGFCIVGKLAVYKFTCYTFFIVKKFLPILTLLCFIVTSVIGTCPVYAQELFLPAPGVRVALSPSFNPPILKGLKVHPDNPFQFDFILDKGDVETQNFASLRNESTKLIKYFLASLTVPEKDLWVNLSPYEKDRIVPESFGQTEMGRDLLAQDYLLKQITASLLYPEDEFGKKFWKRVYEEAAKKYGTTNIPVNTFNKVWIVPEKAVVYENAQAGTAYVVESRLKVMLEQDYLALEKGLSSLPDRQAGPNASVGDPGHRNDKDVNALGSQIVREIVIPELTKEVNEGKNFTQLRQVYNSLILATWYKKKIKDSILSQVYLDKNKIQGINIPDPNQKQQIYEQYLKAFKKGVYNYIKEEQDLVTQQVIPRKYFSGGAELIDVDSAMVITSEVPKTSKTDQAILSVNMAVADNAMVGDLANIKERGRGARSLQEIMDALRSKGMTRQKWEAQFGLYGESVLGMDVTGRDDLKAIKLIMFNGRTLRGPDTLKKIYDEVIDQFDNDQGQGEETVSLPSDDEIRADNNGEKIAAAILGLQREGKQIFSLDQADKLSRKRRAGERVLFLKDIVNIIDIEGRYSFSASQLMKITLSYKLGNEGSLLEQISWALKEQDTEGKPLFNGYQISQIILSGATMKEKQDLIADLVVRKDEAGKPLFNGYQISYVVRYYTKFERSKFESILKMSAKLKISPTLILYFSILTSEGKNTIKKWLIKNTSDLSGRENRLIYSLLSNTEFNVNDLISLIKILFIQEEQADVLKNLENKNEVLNEIAKRVLGRDLKNSDNEDVKNLLMSPNYEIRQQAIGRINTYVYSNLGNIAHRDEEDITDAVDMYINSYDWARPNAGLGNLVRNSRIIIQYRKSYLYWKRLPDHVRAILWKVKQLNREGLSNGDVERRLVDAGYSHYEIAQAMGFRQVSLDAPFNLGEKGNLYDVIASETTGIDLRDIAVEEEGVMMAHTVNVNVMGKIVPIQADTVGQALRIYWERYEDPQQVALIKNAVNEGRSDVSIDGETVDPTEVLGRSLEGIHDISIRILSNDPKEEETDRALLSSANDALKGGIDFNTDKMNLQVQNSGGEIKFTIDPAMLEQLQNAPGFVPVIINIQPMNDIRDFLGLSHQESPQQTAGL